MKSKKTRFTALAIVALSSALFLGACGGQKQATTSSSSSKTSQVTKSSKMTKSSSKVKTEKKTQASSSEEKKAEVSENAGETKQVSPAKVAEENQQEEKQEQPTNTPNSDKTKEETTEPGRGGREVTSGTLDIDKDVPVYTSTDKSTVAYTQPAGTSVDWDDYLVNVNNDYWYSFVKDGVRYYIAYSDIGH
ncbi:hypothetical protein STRDD10_00684 [Streptococcus sp. DD10]|uniref:hypothetical protein n=1 Tax=Streptococcus sp. DD10 TaxID=1777878 RepID=UPI00079BD1EC|nr:hypothetical protein [Streptococcus sp. DD10]KXT74738.1 hypothetical protein STRDD10_00684 [Streptococcus sp. DD10]